MKDRHNASRVDKMKFGDFKKQLDVMCEKKFIATKNETAHKWVNWSLIKRSDTLDDEAFATLMTPVQRLTSINGGGTRLAAWSEFLPKGKRHAYLVVWIRGIRLTRMGAKLLDTVKYALLEDMTETPVDLIQQLWAPPAEADANLPTNEGLHMDRSVKDKFR